MNRILRRSCKFLQVVAFLLGLIAHATVANQIEGELRHMGEDTFQLEAHGVNEERGQQIDYSVISFVHGVRTRMVGMQWSLPYNSGVTDGVGENAVGDLHDILPIGNDTMHIRACSTPSGSAASQGGQMWSSRMPGEASAGVVDRAPPCNLFVDKRMHDTDFDVCDEESIFRYCPFSYFP